MIPAVRKQTLTGKTASARKVRMASDDYAAQAEVFLGRMLPFAGTDGSEYSIRFLTDSRLPDGGYLLDTDESGAAVTVSGPEGAACALTTLYLQAKENGGRIPGQHTEDSPHYAHRGFMMDTSRHFFSAEDVMQVIDRMSLLKLNRFHWHISDDQGYRIESLAFPELNGRASWRTEPDGSRHGGFYTQEQIRQIVRFAKARGIEIIPEIDMPGHVQAFVSAYPELGCPGTAVPVWNGWGISEEVFCTARQSTYDFVFRLLDEVTPLFPYEYFHIGGDEVPTAHWKQCPDCRRMMQQKGMKSERELQTVFMERVIAHLRESGRRVICWNDYLHAGKWTEDVLIHYWFEAEDAMDPSALRPDQKFIFSQCRSFYFDFPEKTVPMEGTACCPVRFDCGTEIPEENIAGFECENWAEWTCSLDQLLAKMYPRVYALAERCWNGTVCMEKLRQQIAAQTDMPRYDGEMRYADWLR